MNLLGIVKVDAVGFYLIRWRFVRPSRFWEFQLHFEPRLYSMKMLPFGWTVFWRRAR